MGRAYTINPDDIRAQEFRSKMRGYDSEQVHSYLEELADQVQHMQSQIRDLRSRLSDAEGDLDKSRIQDPDSTSPGMPMPHITAEYREEAKADAAGLVERAQAEADMLVASARAQVDDLNRQVDELKALRERFVSQSETLLHSQLEHLRVLRTDLLDEDNGEAPEAQPILADLDENTRPG